jgi:hypothetical protein
MLRALCSAAAWLGIVLASGCASPVVDRSYPGLGERRAPIHKIAVAPFRARAENALEAAPLLAHQLAQALAARGVDIVAPEDVARLTETSGGVAELAAAAAMQFGADAVLVGEVTRWVEREGEALGSQRAASVGVRIVLHGAPGGERLWEASFDRTQQALLENVLLTPRYPGGGTRWLSAAEFARFAATELAAKVPVTP